MILNKRVKRDFFDNFLRNAAMILIISLSMSLVVSLASSTDCITYTIHDEWMQCNLEDGCFETYIPLSKRNLKELSKLNVTIEKMFYSDVPINSESTLRIFSGRDKINLPYLELGTLPRSDNEIFIEKNYASSHHLTLGDTLEIGNSEFSICGIGCLPDYGYVKQNTGDVAANEDFSVAIVTKNAQSNIKGSNKTIYNYAYKLNAGCTVKKLKDKLSHLKFDTSAVKDTYLNSHINAASDLKNDFNTASDNLKFGASYLETAINRLGDSLSGIGINADTKSLAGLASELNSGIDSMQQRFGYYLEENTDIDLVNLSSFGEAKYNIRITNALDDSKISKQSGLVVGIFLLILLVYMLSVFAGGMIEKERSVIGTLYALGYSEREILSHYIKIPMLVSSFGAILGTIGGFLLTDTMAASSAALYSFPDIKHVYPLYLLAYSLGVPIVFSYIINRFVLSKKLKASPLQMMRESPRSSGAFNIKLGNIKFETKYRIRQFLRELSGNVTLFFGIIVSILLIMFSVSCYGSINKYINSITDDINYNYMYLLRNPVNDLPKNSHLGYTRGFYVDFPMTGTEMEVALLGIDYDNPYFDFASSLGDSSDKIYMSDSARIKFGYHTGDKVVFKDNADDKLYAFEIADEVKFGNGLYFFMNIDAMRKAFGQEYFDEADLKVGEKRRKSETYYYNTVFSDTKLTFKHNMMLSETAKSDIKSGAEKFLTLMWDMIIMMIAVSIIIFVSVMYLLMKLEIDRSSFSISLLKALGYPEKTVNSFYLGSSFYVMLAAIIFGIPVCRVVVAAAYPFCVSNVNAGFEAVVSPAQYGIIIFIVLAAYFLTKCMLIRYLRKIKLTEILKNRE